MGRLLGKQRSRDALLGIALALSALALVTWPRETMSAMKDGLSLCGNVIVPSLFPFLVLSTLVVELGMSRYLGRLLEPVMAPLFRVNGACATALALGFIGGYPVGARTAIQLYRDGQCSKTEAERLLAFCNNCGPAFILGVVGTGVFGSSTAGLALYFGHLTASLLIGLLFRFYKPGVGCSSHRANSPQFHAARCTVAFTHAVTDAMQSTLNICAFVLFFAVVIRVLNCSGLFTLVSGLLAAGLARFHISRLWIQRLLVGLLELSAGVSSLTGGSLTARLSMAAFLLGWAGLSVHCQVMAFLGDSGLSMRTYLTGKFLHGLFSAAILSILARILPIQVSVSFYLAEQTETIARMDFQQALAISAAAAWLVWLLFLLLTAYIVKKSSRKRMRSVL